MRLIMYLKGLSISMILVIISLLSCSNLSAQTSVRSWTLKECIQYAMDNNIQIKRQELQSLIADKNYKQSRFELLPNMNVGFEHIYSSGRSLNQELYQWENRNQQQGSMGVRSEVTVFNGLQNLNSIKQQKYNLKSALEDLEKAKNDISIYIATAYLQILLDQELLNVAKNQLEVTMVQVDKTETLVKVGNVSKGTLLEIKAQAASEKLNIIQRNNQLRISKLTLVQLLDLENPEEFSIVIPKNLSIENQPAVVLTDSVFNYAVINMPEVKSAEYMLQSQKKALAITRGRRSPELYLSGLYYSRYNENAINPLDPDPLNPSINYSLDNQLKDNQYKQITLGLSIPIFNKLRIHRDISIAKVNMLDAQYNLKQSKQNLYKNIQQAYSDAVSALEKYYSSYDAVKSMQEAFDYTSEKFDVGLSSSIDYSIAKNNLSKTQSDLLQAKYEYLLRLKILDFYHGEEITF
ncbi:MAG: TolC family protein [Bacteroidetes bacterium]|nr:TolC family protein [Bacteroidota bacterium]